MKLYNKIILTILSILVSKFSFSACTAVTPYLNATINPGGVVVQRDMPVGSEIGVFAVPQTTGNQLACDASGGNIYYLITYPGATYTGTGYIYTTNLPGVGFKVTSSIYGFSRPAYKRAVPGSLNITLTGSQNFLVLYKIGDISSGALQPGQLASVYDDSLADAYRLYLTGGTVTQLACSITTPTLNFPIGDISASSFGSSVGTIPAGAQNTQNLGLNCDAGANINVTLQGTQNPDVATTSVLALTGQGSAGVANGVGVQLLYNGVPLVLNSKLVLKKSAGGQETFPLTARYYQTKSNITAGKANTSATLNITYQ